jgi:16S rRNA (guanine966-N2)-methyltransferase
VRIIGGKFKGRLIEPPKGFKARPTTDFARESLMNILNNRYDFSALSLLDLFGGTGAISYEFASRGTEEIDIIETDRHSCEFIRKTLKQFDMKGARIHRMDVRDWLKICHRQYTIIFADPPYELKWLTDIPDMALRSGAVKDNTLLILEHPKSLDFNHHEAFQEHRSYGNVTFTFFRHSSTV